MISSKQRKENEMEQARESVGEIGKAIAAVQTVTSEVVGFKVSVNGGMQVVVESDMTNKLLMRKLLKFNDIEADGEARVHRKAYGSDF
ncbi:hypothetical protein IGI04_002665 [Brassica rapa subsp. trilocularis]|uniref:Uncharacterized protein n=1 Tax=Brassica rapa subsp. trilocularis TaxID=1813537 RepID=A0ABQ7NW62_BRACM|nr:hypothetical protein IGI04_002665 [Brassica rapa subsp. trilocularis]